MIMSGYHGTPRLFDQLNSGSWITTSRIDAMIQLLMKNMQSEESDLLKGWVIFFNKIDLPEGHDFIDIGGVNHFTTSSPLEVKQEHRYRLKSLVERLPPKEKAIFYPSETIDLTSLIKS